MKRERAVIDASTLPSVVYGDRNILWWGTVSFMTIEAVSLAICAVTYIYLRKNFVTWPPERTELPSLLVPSIEMAIMLLSLPLAIWTKHRAERMELGPTRIGMIALSVVSVVVFALRLAGFWSLNTQWNSDAYGSIIWATMGFHASLILIEVYELIGLSAVLYSRNREAKHYPDVAEIAGYWVFIVLTWLPLYVLVFFGPRIL